MAFGAVTCVTGIVGTLAGSVISKVCWTWLGETFLCGRSERVSCSSPSLTPPSFPLPFISLLRQKLESKTPGHDCYVCGVGLLLCVVFMGVSLPVAVFNLPLFWFLVLIAEVRLKGVE
jgi:hypothetical protein